MSKLIQKLDGDDINNNSYNQRGVRFITRLLGTKSVRKMGLAAAALAVTSFAVQDLISDFRMAAQATAVIRTQMGLISKFSANEWNAPQAEDSEISQFAWRNSSDDFTVASVVIPFMDPSELRRHASGGGAADVSGFNAVFSCLQDMIKVENPMHGDLDAYLKKVDQATIQLLNSSVVQKNFKAITMMGYTRPTAAAIVCLNPHNPMLMLDALKSNPMTIGALNSGDTGNMLYAARNVGLLPTGHHKFEEINKLATEKQAPQRVAMEKTKL